MKKLSCLLLALVTLIGSVTFTSNAVSESGKSLKFREDGTFTVLQLADLQDSIFFRPLTKQFIIDLLEKTDPDLVVLTGDNIGPGSCYFQWMTKKNIDNFMSIFEERGVKVAAVFGNHDFENANTKDEQFEMYQSYSCFIGSEGETEKALTGCGTYNIPIMSGKDSDKKAFNLWFFDSQEYNEENDLGGYGCVQKDQIEWYINTEKALKEENGGKAIPSLAFQHIIVPEIYDVLTETGEKNESGEIINTSEEYNEDYSIEKNGIIYTLPKKYIDEDTFLSETPCPPEYSNGQADAMKKNGKVLGIAVGHDHMNSFVIPYNGIDIIQTPTAGLGAYGDMNRGARVITLNENDLSDYETDVIFFRDYYDLSDKELFYRFVFNSESNDYTVMDRISAMFKWFYYRIVN